MFGRAKEIMDSIPYKAKVSVNKWKEKDKKTLLDKVRDIFFQLRKMRINVMRIDPNKQKRRRRTPKTHFPSKRKKVGELSEVEMRREFSGIDNESSVMSSNAISRTSENKEPLYKV